MKDDDGRVLVDHFYDGIAPLSETEKRAIAEAPAPDADLMKELWLGVDRRRAEEADRTAAAAFAEYPRHGEFADRRAGLQRDSFHRDSVHRHAAGERHGSPDRPSHA